MDIDYKEMNSLLRTFINDSLSDTQSPIVPVYAEQEQVSFKREEMNKLKSLINQALSGISSTDSVIDEVGVTYAK